MKMKIALAALACSGTLLALLPTSASAAPLSGLSQNHGWPLRIIPCSRKCIAGGAGVGVPTTGMATGMGMATATGTATHTIGLTIALTGRTITAATTPHHLTIITGRTGAPTIRCDCGCAQRALR